MSAKAPTASPAHLGRARVRVETSDHAVAAGGPGLHVQGRGLAYRAPVGRFLFGVLAEGSAATGRRHIWRLTMPLFGPSGVLDLSYSERISTVSVEPQSAFAEAVGSAIKTLPSKEAEMARLAELTPGPNIRLDETAAYANTYPGKIDRAIAILEAARATADDHEWVGEIKERLQRFERLLRDDGQAGAVEHLDAQRPTQPRR
jgi:hypothetical protein